VDRGADVQLVRPEPAVEQELRAQGADQPHYDRGFDDPSALETSDEESANLTKQVLISGKPTILLEASTPILERPSYSLRVKATFIF
jgi:hypothetical protein